MDSQTLSILKSSMVRISDDRYMLVIYSYHTEPRDGSGKLTDKSKSFYRCDACIKSPDSWNCLADSIFQKNPAMVTTNTDIGFGKESGTFSLRYGNSYMTNSRVSRWLRLKIRKAEGPVEFSEKAFAGEFPFLRILHNGHDEYDIIENRMDIPADVWIGSVKQKEPRRKPKVIY